MFHVFKGNAPCRKGIRVMTVAPMYEEYEGLNPLQTNVPLRSHIVQLLLDGGSSDDETENFDVTTLDLVHCDDEGVDRVFVKHPMLCSRDIYEVNSSGPGQNLTYQEDGSVSNLDIRCNILCQGALAAGALLNESLTDKLVFVLNDWPAALHALRLKYALQSDVQNKSEYEHELSKKLQGSKTLFCIHNLAYQGVFPASRFQRLCLPKEALRPLLATPEHNELHETADLVIQELIDVSLDDAQINFMKAGLLCSDGIVTVSPNYAIEIKEDEILSCGLREVFRRRHVTGIMNGIDVDIWNSYSDVYLPVDAQYSADTAQKGKSIMKQRLQCRLGLTVDENSVLFVFVGRLTEQKGLDVLLSAFVRLFPKKPAPDLQRTSEPRLTPSSPFQLIILGTGDRWMEKAVEGLNKSFPGHAVGVCEFSEELAHWLLGAADYALVPSQFEPCGLIAQCAARYGAIPICTATGGLKDLGEAGIGRLIPPLVPTSNKAGRNRNIDDLTASIEDAIQDYRSEKYYREQRTCMQHDFSWEGAAEEWHKLISDL